MEYIDTSYYIVATPLALTAVFSGGIIAIAAFLGLVGLWLCRSLIAGLCEYR